jgi:hypothetical protein
MLVVLENVTRMLPSLDPRERRSEVGRLILAPAALHYVQGWEVHTQSNDGGGALGALIDLAGRKLERVDVSREGARMLAEVAGLAPEEQVRAVAGSVTVPTSDIETAGLSLLASILKVITEARGEVYNFAIDRGDRSHVKTWLAGLRRK